MKVTLDLEKLTDDPKIIGAIIKGLKKKDGHCPCIIEKSEDTICPCKDYRNTGHCHCSLYKDLNEKK